MLGYLIDAHNQPQTRLYTEEALAICREMGYFSGVVNELSSLAMQDYRANRLEQASILIEEVFRLRKLHNLTNVFFYYILGGIALRQRKLEDAKNIFDEGIRQGEHQGDIFNTAWSRAHRACVALFENKLEEAEQRFCECQDIFHKINSRIGVAFCQEGMTMLLTQRGEYAEALARYTWANKIRRETGDTRPLVEQLELDPFIETIRANLGEAELQAAQAHGESLTLEDVLNRSGLY